MERPGLKGFADFSGGVSGTFGETETKKGRERCRGLGKRRTAERRSGARSGTGSMHRRGGRCHTSKPGDGGFWGERPGGREQGNGGPAERIGLARGLPVTEKAEKSGHYRTESPC